MNLNGLLTPDAQQQLADTLAEGGVAQWVQRSNP